MKIDFNQQMKEMKFSNSYIILNPMNVYVSE